MSDQQQVIGALAEPFQNAMPALMAPFEERATMPINKFLDAFFPYLNVWLDRLSIGAAEVLRSRSVQANIRGTTTKALAQMIRNEVFEPLDAISASYAEECKKTLQRCDFHYSEAAATNVAGDSLQGALTGRVIGGFSSSGTLLATLGGIGAGNLALARSAQSLSAASDALHSLGPLAVSKVQHILAAIPATIGPYLDYGMTQTFGAEVDFSLIRSETDRLTDTIRETTRRLADQLTEMQQAAAEEAKVRRRQARLHAETAKRERSGSGYIWSGIILMVFAGLGFMTALADGDADTWIVVALFGGAGLWCYQVGQKKKQPVQLTNSKAMPQMLLPEPAASVQEPRRPLPPATSSGTDIYIFSENTNQGPYSPKLVRQMVDNGFVSEDALYWDTKSSEWRPVGELL